MNKSNLYTVDHMKDKQCNRRELLVFHYFLGIVRLMFKSREQFLRESLIHVSLFIS